MIETIIIAALSILLATTLLDNLVQRKRKNNLLKLYIQSLVDIDILKNELQTKADVKALTETEAFVKFLSDSRDKAYEYIESVQESLKKFFDNALPQIKYYNTYGKSVPSHLEPIVDKLVESIEDLEKVMPIE
jgi:hypothetical protein